MKVKHLMMGVIAAAFALSSCGGEDARLAGELVGTWKGQTTAMMKNKKDKPDKDRKHHNEGGHERGGRMDGGDMNCTPTFTFVRTDGTNGGTLDISADYTVTKGVEASTSTPVNATFSGTVKTSGTWMVKDGDEVMVTIDPSKTVVDVDTSSVALSYARITDASQDSLSVMKGRVASNIADIVKPMLAARVQQLRKFDDVKITGNTMTLEVDHNRISFTKQ